VLRSDDIQRLLEQNERQPQSPKASEAAHAANARSLVDTDNTLEREPVSVQNSSARADVASSQGRALSVLRSVELSLQAVLVELGDLPAAPARDDEVTQARTRKLASDILSRHGLR
jgi:hypothetical protein